MYCARQPSWQCEVAPLVGGHLADMWREDFPAALPCPAYHRRPWRAGWEMRTAGLHSGVRSALASAKEERKARL